MMEDTWKLLADIFCVNNPLTKNQYFDSIHSRQVAPETRLWLDIFKLTCEDWLEHQVTPSSDSIKWVREIESWVFENSFGMTMISLAIYSAHGIDPDLFKRKFRMWLREQRVIEAPKPFLSVELEEPLESITEALVWEPTY